MMFLEFSNLAITQPHHLLGSVPCTPWIFFPGNRCSVSNISFFLTFVFPPYLVSSLSSFIIIYNQWYFLLSVINFLILIFAIHTFLIIHQDLSRILLILFGIVLYLLIYYLIHQFLL